MARSTCRDCNRNVAVTMVDGRPVALDPEPIMVVRLSRGGGRLSSPDSPPFAARRIHAERCADYQEQDRRERLRSEMREYTHRHGRTAKPSRRTGM